MKRSASARTITNKPLLAVGVGLVLIIAALLAVLEYQGARTGTHSLRAAGGSAPAAPDRVDDGDSSDDADPPGDGDLPDDAGLTAKDGLVPDHVTLFDDQYPAVSKLDPELLAALRAAASDAADEGIELVVNSGWRSARYQDQLLKDAIVQYGSAAEAARWVATAQTSPHVAGLAVDIGPASADSWLSHNGADYGLCQIYRNEPWHFELRAQALRGRCPAPYADPTQDPRMSN